MCLCIYKGGYIRVYKGGRGYKPAAADRLFRQIFCGFPHPSKFWHNTLN
jgi:hypothetical protein